MTGLLSVGELRRALADDDTGTVLAAISSGEASVDDAFEAAIFELGGERPDLLRKLIDTGADVNRPLGDLAEPALLRSARRGDVGLYRVLRKGGASMRAKDGLGHNLIHSAALGGQVKILGDALAYKKLDPNERSEAGFTPFMLVLRRVTDEPAVRVEAKARKILEVLLEAGVKPDPEDLREAKERGFRGLSERLRAVGVAESPEPPTFEATEPMIEPHVSQVPTPKKRTRTRRIRRKKR